MKQIPSIINDKVLTDMWEELGDIPVNEDDTIDDNFYIWESGTDRFYIWEWFDDNHTQGVAKGLLHLE